MIESTDIFSTLQEFFLYANTKKEIQTTDSWPGYQFEMSSAVGHRGYTDYKLQNINFPKVKVTLRMRFSLESF